MRRLEAQLLPRLSAAASALQSDGGRCASILAVDCVPYVCRCQLLGVCGTLLAWVALAGQGLPYLTAADRADTRQLTHYFSEFKYT
jgi:hypothetical protein